MTVPSLPSNQDSTPEVVAKLAAILGIPATTPLGAAYDRGYRAGYTRDVAIFVDDPEEQAAIALGYRHGLQDAKADDTWVTDWDAQVDEEARFFLTGAGYVALDALDALEDDGAA